jgi:hypothetical protein
VGATAGVLGGAIRYLRIIGGVFADMELLEPLEVVPCIVVEAEAASYLELWPLFSLSAAALVFKAVSRNLR